jgi:hypothetical protein
LLRSAAPKQKRVRCWLGLHSWTKFVREGESWMECRHCGKYADQARAIFGSSDSQRW